MFKQEKRYNGLIRAKELQRFKAFARDNKIPRNQYVAEWESWKERKFDAGEYTAYQLNEWAYKSGY